MFQVSKIALYVTNNNRVTEDKDSVKKPEFIVDVGCRISGPAIYLVKKYGAKCIGIDITPIMSKVIDLIQLIMVFRLRFKLETHFSYPFLMGNWILFGPQSAKYTCLIKQ
ncbi:hypothetical protein GIB67_024588, partial [Kingdonia uniflora]